MVEQANKAGHQPPSGWKHESPATAGSGESLVKSSTPENRLGRINPSAPNDGITPHASGTEKSEK